MHAVLAKPLCLAHLLLNEKYFKLVFKAHTHETGGVITVFSSRRVK